jgi:hypothetical protein
MTSRANSREHTVMPHVPVFDAGTSWNRWQGCQYPASRRRQAKPSEQPSNMLSDGEPEIWARPAIHGRRGGRT